MERTRDEGREGEGGGGDGEGWGASQERERPGQDGAATPNVRPPGYTPRGSLKVVIRSFDPRGVNFYKQPLDAERH